MVTSPVRTARLAALALSLAAASPALAKRMVHRHPGRPDVLRAAVTPDAANNNNVTMPHINYCGGRVLTGAKIVAVLWGTPDALAPTPSCQASTFQECLDGYYKDFLSDPQFDWITEYNTPSGGTNGGLHISRPTYAGIFQITPSNTATTIGESATETELDAQISAGHLPAPDANIQTMYQVFFPLSVYPSDGPNSGNAGCCDFCAYHDSYTSNTLNGQEVLIGIFPSAVPGGYPGTCSGESYGPDCSDCGERSDWFQNLGGSISHEVFETITDPDVGLWNGDSCASPAGWYDLNNSDAMSAHGEVADMCEGFNDADFTDQITEETFSAPDGGSYTVQRLWSNAHNACLADDSGAFTINNPTQTQAIKAPRSATTLISLPATATLDAGTLPIQYALHWGAYPDAGLPAGVTATFTPAQPVTGQNTVMALTLNSTASTTFTFGVSAENGIAQAQTIVKISNSGVTAPDAGTPGSGGPAGGSGGGSAGGSGGGSAGGSGGGSAGGSGGGSAGSGGSGGGSGGGSSSASISASLSPGSVVLNAGSSAQTVLTTSSSDVAGAFTLISNTVPGVTVSPLSGTIGTPLTLTVNAAAGSPSASASITLDLSASGATASTPLALVLSGDDASLSVPSGLSVQPGASVSFTVSSRTVDGNPQQLALSATGLPSGVSATFSPTSITSGSTSTATISVPASQADGALALKIVGQGPIAQISTDLSLEVSATSSSGNTGSSGGCASPGVFPLALLGLAALRRKRRAA